MRLFSVMLSQISNLRDLEKDEEADRLSAQWDEQLRSHRRALQTAEDGGVEAS